jgi:protein-S-isoprenylcysteine O-methyltransferase Ste14
MTILIAKIIWSLGCVAYFVIRYPRMRRSRKTPILQRFDFTRESLLMGISYTGLFIIPLIYLVTEQPKFADYSFHAVQAWIGLVILVTAMALLYRTHRDLGRLWSMTLELRDGHTLVTDGIYHTIRHPMYSAFWLWAISQAFLLPNWIAGLSGIVGFGVLFFARVGREEQIMVETFGDEYRAYMARTCRIIPGIY